MSRVMLWLPVQSPLHSLFSRTFMSSWVWSCHVTTLVSSEVRAALAPMPATSTYSHAPTMSTHASLSATPRLVPKCTSPGHAESVSPASGDPYPAPPQDHYTSQPQSNIPGPPQPQVQKPVIRSTLALLSQPSSNKLRLQLLSSSIEPLLSLNCN